MQDRHWIFIQKLADELKCDVVVPIYTLAPLATGTACVQTSIELLVHLQKDDIRYRGKEFVLCGDSAGGWIALRVLLALVERLAGKTAFRTREDELEERELKLKQPEDIDYQAILDSVSDVLMISPVVDATVDRPEDMEAEKRVSTGPSGAILVLMPRVGPMAIEKHHRRRRSTMELRPRPRLSGERLQPPRRTSGPADRLGPRGLADA